MAQQSYEVFERTQLPFCHRDEVDALGHPVNGGYVSVPGACDGELVTRGPKIRLQAHEDPAMSWCEYLCELEGRQRGVVYPRDPVGGLVV